MALHNLARMTSATSGTGTLTLGSAVSGRLTFALAGVIDGEKVKYTILDGANAESGIGTYTSSGTTLSRDTVENSTNGGAKISCSGSEEVLITDLVSDFPLGWLPYAYMIGFPVTGTPGSQSLAAQWATMAVPMILNAPMLLESVTVRQQSTSLERTWGWDLYYHRQNDGLSAMNTLTRIAAGNADETFTPGAAGSRTITAASAPAAGDGPILLSPGVYWSAVQNRHASNPFALGVVTSSAFAPNTAQSKTTAGSNGSTLDFVAATWTKVTNYFCVRLDGRVFGQTAAF
jgi:hypothetical protein